jgi:uncharacterized protein YbjT (DUF2867 family)
VSALTESLPQAEAVVANYHDPASLESALADVDGVFLITPDFLDEDLAMRNFIAAAKAVGTVRHIVRITGDPPGIDEMSRVPQILREWEGGTAIQHQTARELLVASGLPVSFVNIAAYIMDDYATMFAPPLLMHRMITLPFDHQMAYIDASDIGEVAGEILLHTDGSFVGTTTHLDNGIDLLKFAEVAKLIGEVLDEPIGFDDTPEKFKEVNGDILRAWVGRDDAPDYYIEYFRWEADVAHTFRTTDVVQRLLGRPAKSLRQWFEENQQALRLPTATAT